MKKRKRRRKVWRTVLSVIAAVILLGLILVFGFRVRTIEVEGNEYYGDNSIATWIQNDKFAENSLYVLLKYNLTQPDVPSAVESMKVSLKNPWTLAVKVTEKTMLGYVDYDEAFLYFDREGIASLRTKEAMEGVPYVEGLKFDASKVVIGETLPVEDDSIFEKIMETSRYLDEEELTPDRLVCTDSGITLYFGNVEVLLGNSGFEERIAQIGPILEKLAESYPDTAGTLHLENFDESSEAVRFVPKEES
ncbi:cell division protein FtsQ [Mediterraneibacter glycyrrhizinilyticus]|nr:cell division protein FtsQ [Mediterraneibacter glycyrrhizinilyticus]MBM6854678.1 cell division protein FtsQ [Mediterraneibacter glycyrrhizinilyticus]